MESENPKFVECYEKAQKYVREELKADAFMITDDKIRAYCKEYDNSFKKVKSNLKKHNVKMTQMDLLKIQQLPFETTRKGTRK